jgi:hypothetical protein
MGTPASLLDLIARGGAGRDAERNRINAATALEQSQAKHADAQTLDTLAQEKMRQQAIKIGEQEIKDQQVFADAFRHTDASPKQVSEYVKANASGAGIQKFIKFQQENEKHALEMAPKQRAEVLAQHTAAGDLLSTLDQLPPEARPAAYAELLPQLQQIDKTVQWMPPEKYTEQGLQQQFGALQYGKHILEQQEKRATIAKTQGETTNAAQRAKQDRLQNFYQNVFPGMPQADYEAAAKEAGVPLSMLPSPAAAIQASRVAGVAPKEREDVEMKAKINKGMTPEGISAKDSAELKAKEEEARQRERQHRESLGVTMRGQDMTNARAKEANDNRPPTAEESKAYGYYKRMDDAAKVLATMDDSMSKKTTLGQAYQNKAPNFMQSEEGQIFNQAKKQFTEAYLRRDSGAAISNGEYVQVDREYFPQPGDTPKTLERKQQARKVAIDAIQMEAGRAIKKFDAPATATSPSSSGGNYEHFMVNDKGHKIGSRGSKWYDVETGKELK